MAQSYDFDMQYCSRAKPGTNETCVLTIMHDSVVFFPGIFQKTKCNCSPCCPKFTDEIPLSNIAGWSHRDNNLSLSIIRNKGMATIKFKTPKALDICNILLRHSLALLITEEWAYGCRRPSPCPLCLCDEEDDDNSNYVTSLCCKQSMHTACITDWLVQTHPEPTCPVCCRDIKMFGGKV